MSSIEGFVLSNVSLKGCPGRAADCGLEALDVVVTLGEDVHVGSFEDDEWLLEVKVCVGSVACGNCELDVYSGMRNIQTSDVITRSSDDMARKVLPIRTLKQCAVEAANELLPCERDPA